MTGEDGVLGNLPNSRPGRRSAKRDGPAKAARAGSAKPKPRAQRTAAVKGGGPGDGVDVNPVIRGNGGHGPGKAPDTPGGDPLSAAVRTAAGLAIGGVKVAGAVTQELVRRLPKP